MTGAEAFISFYCFRSFLLIALVILCGVCLGVEEFSEDLLLRPLPDGKVLTHFYFRNTLVPLLSSSHHHVFPKAISQLVEKFKIQEMELSFTQGRWKYERWGALDPIASSSAKPSGVELWAMFNVPPDQVDATWRNLTHALSGLFCASINFLESSVMVATPRFSFASNMDGSVGRGVNQGIHPGEDRICMEKSFREQGTNFGMRSFSSGGSAGLRYGALPREAVCTENLTPWLKLLPCRDKAGLTTLLDRPSIYKGSYHALRVHIQSGAFDAQGGDTSTKGTVLEQTLSIVLQPTKSAESFTTNPQSWSLSEMFERGLTGSCPLAKSSHVYLELEGSLIDKINASEIKVAKKREVQSDANGICCMSDLHPQKSGSKYLFSEKETFSNNAERGENPLEIVSHPRGGQFSVVDNSAFLLTFTPDAILKQTSTGQGSKYSSLLLDFWVPNHSKTQPFEFGMTWKSPISWSSFCGPFRVTRFLTGSGNEKGSIVFLLLANNFRNQQPRSVATIVTIFQLVPWYVRLYSHTLSAMLDGRKVELAQVVTHLLVSPAEDRISPTVMELQLEVPATISSVSLILEFDKGFLRIDEHPPDANRGFDLPSAVIGFPDSLTSRQYLSSDVLQYSGPLVQTLLKAGPVRMYTDRLLIPLATPDFSMPYNVITFTCTVLALYFGSLLNTLRRRISDEEQREKMAEMKQGGKLRLLCSKLMEGKTDNQKQVIKLLSVIAVAAMAVVANHFLDLGG